MRKWTNPRKHRRVQQARKLNASKGGNGDGVQLVMVRQTSYVRKLVTELSGGVFGYLDSVLERHSFDEFGELI